MFNSREEGGENVFIKGMLVKSVAISAVYNRRQEILVKHVFKNRGCHRFGREGFV